VTWRFVCNLNEKYRSKGKNNAKKGNPNAEEWMRVPTNVACLSFHYVSNGVHGSTLQARNMSRRTTGQIVERRVDVRGGGDRGWRGRILKS